MYVVRVVQGVHSRKMQPLTQAHAQPAAQGPSYSKESFSISSGRTTVLAIQGQIAHRTPAGTLITRSTAAAGPPVIPASPLVVTSLAAHRGTTAAGMISCLWRPLRNPTAVTVKPPSSSSSAIAPAVRSKHRLTIYNTLDGSRSSAVIHLPHQQAGSSSSSSCRRLTAAHTAPVLPLPLPAAVRSAAWAMQQRFVPANSILLAAAAAGPRRERSLQRTAAAAVHGYLVHHHGSSSSKIIIRRPRTVALLPVKYGSNGVAASSGAPRPAAAPAPFTSGGSTRRTADRSAAWTASSSRNPAAVGGHNAGHSAACVGGSSSSSSSGGSSRGPRVQPGAAAAADGTGSFLALPTASLKLARMGVAIMGLAAAAALAAVYLSETRRSKVSGELRSDQPETAAATAAAALQMHNKSSGGSSGAVDSYEGPMYYAWMEKRLRSALQQFEREQEMLHAELAMLQTLSKKSGPGSSSSGGGGGMEPSGDRAAVITTDSPAKGNRLGGIWSRLKGWIAPGSSSSSNLGKVAEISGSSTAPTAAAATAAGLTPDAISSRMVEIRDQIESLDVLRAALTAELLEQQQQQQRADVQQTSQQYATLADGH